MIQKPSLWTILVFHRNIIIIQFFKNIIMYIIIMVGVIEEPILVFYSVLCPPSDSIGRGGGG